MKQDPMPVLEKPPNLRFLKLGYNVYGGSTMVFSANGFSKPETLQLYELKFLKAWMVEKDAMPIQRITELLIHEAASLKSVKEDVILLQSELRSLQGFLKDADSKQEHDQRLRELVHQVHDVASDAEDVIDTYILKVTSSRIKKFHAKRIRPQINSVRARIQSIINTSMQIYGFKFVVGEGTSSMVELQRHLRRSSPNDDGDNDVVSLESSTKALTAELTKKEGRLCIVSVVGMGGLGKTTLAKKVFSSLKQKFDCSAWVFISQQYVSKDVLIDIFTQVHSPNENMKFKTTKSGIDILEQKKNEREMLNSFKEHELVHLLKDKLKEKRFLVVLDDIWTIVAWNFLKRAFPKGKNGSKVLFTTRNKEVATFADPWSTPIEPPLLTLEESWELLQRKAFPRNIVGDRCYPPEYEKLGKKMVKKCGGLPLAVVVLGGLLSTKSSLDEWKKVLRDVNSHLNKVESRQEYEGVNEILALSYHELPYNLKPCFLYLGNFPEDFEMSKSKLVRLWIGEGFIPTTPPTRSRDTEQRLIEEIAEGFFKELIDRCMVQVDKRDHTGIGVKTCRMHDLMRDLCKSKAREENFAQIIDESNMSIDGSATSFETIGSSHSRRLVIHSGVDLDCSTHWASSSFFRKLLSNNNPSSSISNWVEQVHPNLRSLLCFVGVVPLSVLKLSNFRMLRVLELHLAGYGTVALGGMGNLIHLRYLCLKINRNISLSSSIGNLRNLHTLHIKSSESVRGSIGMISSLIRLRHLLLPYYLQKKNQNHCRIDKLKDIETLKNIPGSVLIRYDALNKLTNLRKISIKFHGNHVQDEVRRVLGSQIVKSGRLRSLQMLMFGKEDEFPSLESLSSCLSLSKLGLGGKIILQRGLIHLPASLTKLNLWNSHMERDSMPELEKLPNLRFLLLSHDAYSGSKMVCSAHGFPKLDTLQLSELKILRKWIVEKGAMPSLKKLTIYYIPKLKMIPEGIEFLTSLKELNVQLMGKSFCDKLQVKNGIEGEDYHKIRHIPSVSVKDIMGGED
ncbi:protein RECOGNITION OF PERONOSPORA PARASITICA 7-like [Ziziphus jujuba]|uniref:Protein RECOGNITION OF PERONOSPORA PARASITICA 7-like n=1 Tax=Ziziphus jujuba TaxID=326968 RepID=A0ABM4AGE4_ZIZJJ|nr:protein RECOGNITION OF PERONOSPORA PARASITICA 7-like [Ziziphus jujuba]